MTQSNIAATAKPNLLNAPADIGPSEARQKPVNRWRFFGRVSTSLLGIAVVAVAMIAAAGHDDKPPASATTPKYVHVIHPEKIEHAAPILLYGVTRASRRATLALTVSGRLSRRPVQIGDVVHKGQVLAKIDPLPFVHKEAEAAQNLERMALELSQLRREEQRTALLVDSGAAPTQALERLRTRVRATAATLEATRTMSSETKRLVRETTLRAPFSGQITAVFVEVGEFVSPGRPVVSIAGQDDIEIEVEAAEAHVADLRTGARVKVDLPLVDRKDLLASVTSISRAGGGPGGLFPVIVKLSRNSLQTGAGVRPGMTAVVKIPRRSKPRLVIPVGAVSDPSGESPALFVVRNGRAYRIAIETGDLVGTRVAVRGKLTTADRVIVAGHATLLPGEQVSPVEPSERSQVPQ